MSPCFSSFRPSFMFLNSVSLLFQLCIFNWNSIFIIVVLLGKNLRNYLIIIKPRINYQLYWQLMNHEWFEVSTLFFALLFWYQINIKYLPWIIRIFQTTPASKTTSPWSSLLFLNKIGHVLKLVWWQATWKMKYI